MKTKLYHYTCTSCGQSVKTQEPQQFHNNSGCHGLLQLRYESEDITFKFWAHKLSQEELKRVKE